MSLIYLASPYSHHDIKIRENRYNKVLYVTARMSSSGFHIFSPIVHGHHITEFCRNNFSETRFKEYYFFNNHEKFLTTMLRKSDAFWILTIDGWKESQGIREEFKIAKLLHLDINFIDEECNIKPFFESDYATKT